MTPHPWFHSSSPAYNDKDDTRLSVSRAVKFMVPPQPAKNSRFSSLLLEYGEIILQDWAVVLTLTDITPPSVTSKNNKKLSKSRVAATTTTKWNQSSSTKTHPVYSSRTTAPSKTNTIPATTSLQLQGRLHLCTKSLVLEPDETLRPIWRFPFAKMEEPPKEIGTNATTSSLADSYEVPMTIQFNCNKYWAMKESNAIGPYQLNEFAHVQITFLHSSPPTLLQLCKKLFSNPTTEELDDVLKPMLLRPFDLTHLQSVGESPVTPSLRTDLISPLQKLPGVLLVTTEAIYFQLATLAEESVLHSRWWTRHVIAYARRYSGLKDCAIELYWRDGTSTLFALDKARDREKIVQALGNRRCLTDRDFVLEALEEWNAGRLSNLDYLLALNTAAGRTFHDLSRYPVVPWILADYTSETLDLTNPKTFRDLSKPMGALDEKRLSYFQMRLQGMQNDGMEGSFLYGTHYSAPGYILYYLVRIMPQHMLCLQNGKFDTPDRVFYSIPQCFECALTNHADVKELIPQFYLQSDFLINAQSLQLGATQNGERVHDVALPTWARSARHFMKQNRKAMECKYVTTMLPSWIDLIFGFSSRGDAARRSQNLFHPTAYLGPGDLATLRSDEERMQAELQAAEFGTVPDQLFENAHPMKGKVADADHFVSVSMGKSSLDMENWGEHSKHEAWELLEPPMEDSVGNLDVEDTSKARNSPTSSQGISMIPNSFKRALNPMSPIGKTDSVDPLVDESRSLATPCGKARASWEMSNLNSLHNVDMPPHDPAYPSSTKSSLKDLDDAKVQHTTSEAQSTQQYPMIGLSGSGEITTSRSRDLSFGGSWSNEIHSRQKFSTPTYLSQSSNKSTPQIGWDMKMMETKKFHGDAVSGCCLLENTDRVYLATVSLDGNMSVHSITLSKNTGSTNYAEDLRRGLTGTLSRFYASVPPPQEKSHMILSPYRSHTASDPLACLSVTDDGYGGQLVFAGGHDDVVVAYGINSACAVASVYAHRDAVTGLDVLARSPLVPTCALWPNMATHIMMSGSWDATVKVWSVAVSAGETVSITREPLAELFDADSTIVCLSSLYIAGTGIAICCGCSDGSFVVWIVHDDGTRVVIHKEPVRRGAGPCASVKWTKENGESFLFAGFANGRISSFLLAGGNLIKISAVSVGIAVTCLEYIEGTLLVGAADGGLRLLPIRDGASFDGKPTLWNSVHGKNNPGLVCISIKLHDERILCCSGADDGSVALFELKKSRT